jgi:hypothetical protein
LKEGFDAAVEATGELEARDPLNEFFRKFDGDAQDVPSSLVAMIESRVFGCG